MKAIEGQISVFEYMAKEYPKTTWGGCGNCICKHCLYWWSMRCPYGGCWDDHRAQVPPYDKAHPDEPPRTGRSNWETDQAYWCRRGVCYPVYECEHYARYTGSQIKECLEANVSVFQDGYILCSLVDMVGCQWCYERWEDRDDED